MLTYIAHRIANGRKCYDPHIAVVIAGGNWYVSVNSEVNQANLPADAQRAREHIKAQWKSLQEKYAVKAASPADTSSAVVPDVATDENAGLEALYIAFRWAAGTDTGQIKVVENPEPTESLAHVHGEMMIIDHLKTLTPIVDKVPTPSGDLRRVVRVGGTKTPCLDCAWEMNKVPFKQDMINQKTEPSTGKTKLAHDANPGAAKIWEGENQRITTTMSLFFGPGFQTWKHVKEEFGKRSVPTTPGSKKNKTMPRPVDYQQEQNQAFDNLRKLYLLTGCTPAIS